MDNLLHSDHHTDLVFGSGLAPADGDVLEALAATDEARVDERAARLAAEETAEQLAQLLARQHQELADERAARERAEIELSRAQRTASEMARLVATHQARAEDAEDRARKAYCAYLDDPFRAAPPTPTWGDRLKAKLQRD